MENIFEYKNAKSLINTFKWLVYISTFKQVIQMHTLIANEKSFIFCIKTLTIIRPLLNTRLIDW